VTHAGRARAAFVIARESEGSQPLAKKNVHADASLTAVCRIKSGNDEW
jgi:hypothetical protein